MKLLVLCVVIEMAIAASDENVDLNPDALGFLEDATGNFYKKSIPEQTKIINDFVDVLLSEIKKYVISNHLDPANLPDLHEEFTYKTIIIKSHGEVNLTDGHFWNISTVHRGGDAGLYKNSSSTMTVKIPLWFTDLMFDYHYSAHLMGLDRMGVLNGRIKEFQIQAVIEIDYLHLRIRLDDFKVEKRGITKLKFRGHLWTDWCANAITSMVTKVYKDTIDKKIEKITRKALENAIDRVNHMFHEVRTNVISQDSYPSFD